MSTLIKDIKHVIKTGGGWSDQISQWVSDDIAVSLQAQHTPRGNQTRLRMSLLGTPCERKLWYTTTSGLEPEPLSVSTRLKFIFGDLTESLILGYAKAAGHSVEGLQTRVYIGDIEGARDAIVDGMLIDVKSASTYSYAKFAQGRLREDDPFGYLSQLSSYLYASRDDPYLTEKTKAGFLAFDKQHGHICLDVYDLTDWLDQKEDEVNRKVAVTKLDKPPDRPYIEEPFGKSGNMKLPMQCSYCDWKKHCWPGVRTFIYSSGPIYLTTVKREPKDGMEIS